MSRPTWEESAAELWLGILVATI